MMRSGNEKNSETSESINPSEHSIRQRLTQWYQEHKLSRSRIVMLGFMGIILVGALLLMLPFASKEPTTFSGALFTSVSATCVTGLIVYDTFSHWTLFGQIVILLEIEIGGLGFITVSTFAMIVMRRRISLHDRVMIQDNLSTRGIRGNVRFVKRITIATFCIEAIGALLLAIRFIPQMGFGKGIYYGIFHSISAFCNAGFDLMGYRSAYSSLCAYVSDPLVILTLSALIIVGGLGFIVWQDLYEHRMHWHAYRLQTKIVITSTAALLIGGTLLFFLMENHRLFAGMSAGQKLLASWFSAVTPRTAGFNSVDTASLSNGSLFLTIILMFIGGSPGSTAGGIKTVTLVVILLHLKAYLQRERDCHIFHTRIDDNEVNKASVIIFINLFLAILGMLIILATQNLPFKEIMFEVFSAIGTSGMSTGVTRPLSLLSRFVIMALMYCGRMGSLTFAMSLTENRKPSKMHYVKGDITLG